jgi:hypothetical protein
MPLENSLSTNPYFDDYDPNNEFYRILFKPGVAVQTRELNQLQSIIQNQIEKFGNHVFKSGTIISGVNFNYLPTYPFIKITDTQVDGQPSLPSSYVDYFLKSSLDLSARVVNYEDGLESASPDLKTLYLQYNNSSDPDTANSSAVYTTFSADQELTVYDPAYPLFKVIVNNGGLGFGNSDTVVITSSLALSNIIGTFTVNQTITQSTTNAKATVKSVNTTAVANTTILQIAPRNVDLTNNSVNSAAWTMSSSYSIVSDGGATANISYLIGSGATALLSTDTQGIIQTVTLGNDGSSYTFLPTVTVKTSNTTATVQNLDLLPQNYKTKVTVSNTTTTPVGSGYAFGVSEGVIYQKGFFLKVDPQVIVIDKYTTSPNNVAVGFGTVETYIDSNADETLYDNASNTTNFSAPGADRLKLTPVLTTLTSTESAANVDFFALAEWKSGFPFKENRVTVYSNLGDELARRTREAQGNFVVDPFDVSTKEKSTANVQYIDVVIDPGLAYIGGYRVATSYNNYLDIARSNTTTTITSQSITASYGNYVLVNELAGLFDFKAGSTVSLYDTAKTYVTARTIPASGGAISPAGSSIGTARIRSLVVDTGIAGTASCTWRMYLFDIVMSAGRAFREVRSIYFDGTIQDGIADISLTYDATSASSIAKLVDTTKDQMLFPVGRGGVKSLTNIVYTYRTVSDATLQISSGGTMAIGPLGSGLTHPYSDGVLSSTQESDFIVFPIANTQSAANAAGTITVTNGAANITGSGTTFNTDFQPGDWIKLANATSTNSVCQISSVTNATHIILTTTAPQTIANANGVLFFPALYPINIDNRADRTITISGSSKTATLSVANTLSGTVNAIAVFNIKSTDATAVPKTITRDVFVKIHTSNNTGSNTGPWSLGVPGTVRLKNVFLGNSSSVGTTANSTVSDVTKYFFINAADDENAYRISNLVLRSGASLAVNTNQFILAKFDVFTNGGAEGFFTVDSYSINDTANLASSTATVNTLEIPESVTSSGKYYDMRNVFDFRPYGSNTATLATSVATANVNPLDTFTLNSDDKFFPMPDSTISFDAQYYNARIDRVIVRKDSTFSVLQGTPSITNPSPPAEPADTVTLSVISIPPYPSLPAAYNNQTSAFASKQIGSPVGPLNTRLSSSKVQTRNTIGNKRQQPRRYTMADIGKLDQRIADIEYQVTLSGLESSIKDLSIPSSITPTTNRFKNGFFIEPFNDYTKASVSSREFAATIDQSESLLKPPVKQINFESEFDRTDATTNAALVNDKILMLPYTEESLINQSIKSSLIGSDGQSVVFAGEGTVTPASFSIHARGEVTITQELPPVQYGSGAATPIVADTSTYDYGHNVSLMF